MNGSNSQQMQTQETMLTPAQIPALQEEIDIQIATAHRYPRNMEQFKAEALSMATIDEETAASCFYKLPRKKKDDATGQWVQGYIEGPGVRLAEIVGSCWRNLRYAARVVREESGCIVAQGMAHDLERNVAMTLEVKRRITYSDGRRYNEDMITLASNAACAIALRNVIFKVVPKAFIDVVYHAAKKKAVGDATTLADRRHRAIEYFAKMGVSEKRILKTIGRNSVTEIGLEELEILTGVRTAIREGDAKVDEIFPDFESQPKSEPYTNKTEALAAKIKQIREQKKKDNGNHEEEGL